MDFLAGTEIFDFTDKIAGITKLPVDGCKAYIGDIVHFLEAVHDFFADGGGRNFPAVLLFELFHHLIDGFFDKFGADGAFFAGFLEAENELTPIKRLITAIPFDGTKVFALNFFVGGKAVVAGETLPAATDDGPVFPGA